jgi:glucose 1-dehydrogenase
LRALTVAPGHPGSARVENLAEPSPQEGTLLVETLAIGVCGTDREILAGGYGWAPPARARLVLGHESLGRVLVAPAGCGLAQGDLVAAIVRRPDPVPCVNCAVGEWDMCRNGRYVERGIKEQDGYGSERYRTDPGYAVKVPAELSDVGVLVEPASVVAKAWEHVERIGRRARWTPSIVLITGAGPIGLLATLIAIQRGLEVHVLDRVTDGPKPDLVRDAGGIYHVGSIDHAGPAPDVIIECTGVGRIVLEVIERLAPGGIVCLTGLSSRGREVSLDAATLNQRMVLENKVVFGSVNANRRHYEAAVGVLARADPRWLERMITRRVPLDRWADATAPQPDDIKTVIDLTKP